MQTNDLPASVARVFFAGIVVLLVLLTVAHPPAMGQQLFVEGGSDNLSAVRSDEPASWVPNYWMGIRTFQADIFQLGVSFGYNNGIALNGELALRPWRGESRRIDPYAFLGYGRYYDDERSTLISSGVGAEVQLGQRIGLFLEVDKSWTSFNTYTAQKTLAGWGSGIGLSYTFNRSNTGYNSPPPAGGVRPRAENPSGSSSSQGARTTADTAVQRDDVEAGHPARFGESVVDPNKYPEMNFVSDGVFTMGLTDEDPLALQTAGIKRVTVNALFIDKHEVTNEDYREYLQSLSPANREQMMPDSSIWEDVRTREGWTAYFRSEPFDDFPVIGVNWEQAQAYCEAQDKRLPTEAEWEYAARAGFTGRIYPWKGHDPQGEDGQYRANYNPGRPGYAADGYAFTAPVDEFPPNNWGFYNMSGNVAEWTMDAYTGTFDELSDFNPIHEDSTETRRVVRGGSWASDAFYIGVGVRDAQAMDQASPYIGFRCARNVGTSVQGEPITAENESENDSDSSSAANINE